MDGSSCHTSKKMKILLNNLFGDNFIQNAPHSQDITYQIETLWVIQKLFRNFIKGLKKFLIYEKDD